MCRLQRKRSLFCLSALFFEPPHRFSGEYDDF